MSTVAGSTAGMEAPLFGKRKNNKKDHAAEERDRKYRISSLSGEGKVYKPERTNIIRREMPNSSERKTKK